jgi:hypothetical protein
MAREELFDLQSISYDYKLKNKKARSTSEQAFIMIC